MNTGDDWSALSAAWKAQPVDVDALRGAVERRSRRMRLMMALDVVLGLVAVVFLGYLYFSTDGITPRARFGLGFCAVAMIGGVWLNYRLRRGLWHAASNSAVDLLKLQRQRRVNAVRMALWGFVALPLGIVGGVLTRPGVAWPGALGLSTGWKLAVVSLILITFVVGTWLYVRRQRRLIAAIDALLGQLGR
jgi:hypothetical protein